MLLIASDFLKNNFTMLILMGALVVVLIPESQVSKRDSRQLFLIFIFAAVLTGLSYLQSRMELMDELSPARLPVMVLLYNLRVWIMLAFIQIAVERGTIQWICYGLAGVHLVITSLSFFTKLVFWFTEDNGFHQGPLFLVTVFTSMIILVIQAIYAVRRLYREEDTAYVVIVYGTAACFFAAAADMFQTYNHFLNETIIISALLYYIYLHVEHTGKVLMEKEEKLRLQQFNLLATQIKPHFMFNVLNTIYGLCELDPAEAMDTISDFSDYIRGNLNIIDATKPVPMEQELEHVKTYLRLEKQRFGDRLHVKYDIERMDFCLPCLSVQVLVENAVKHGICVRPEGGTLQISIGYKDGYWYAEVSDDGVGFDVDQVKNDGRKHIGIANVRERLAYMSHGLLMIQSIPGDGTSSLILIPEKYGKLPPEDEKEAAEDAFLSGAGD